MRSGDSARAKMQRGGWAPPGGALSYARLRRLHLDSLVMQLRARKVVPLTGPARFHFLWSEWDRHRDPDNVAAGGAKLIFDALQVSGILPKDGARWVAEIHHVFCYGHPHGYSVTLRIDEDTPPGNRELYLRGRLPDLNELLAAREVGARRSARRAV